MEKKIFKRIVVAYKRYFLDFFDSQESDVRDKILDVLDFVRDNQIIPRQFFKHITDTDGIYEIRIEYENNTYRIFSFFDKGNLIILGNAFQKKTQKTPQKEIKKAIQIRKEYFDEKE